MLVNKGFTVDFFRHISCESFLVIVLTEPKDMLIHSAIVCLWFIFLAECKTLNFIDVRRCVDDHSPLSVDTAGHVSFLN